MDATDAQIQMANTHHIRFVPFFFLVRITRAENGIEKEEEEE